MANFKPRTKAQLARWKKHQATVARNAIKSAAVNRRVSATIQEIISQLGKKNEEK